MRLLGCFKAVPAFDLLTDEDWASDSRQRIDTEYVKLEWNCFDEGALEMMRRLSELSEGLDVVYELDALTIGKKKTDGFLKILYALGFSHAVRVEAEEGEYFPPELIAGLIRAYAEKQAECRTYDVIVTGTQSADGSHMKMPYLLAEMLEWPCISQVTGIEPAGRNYLKVTSRAGGGKKIQIVKPPCVLAVENAPCAYLKIPTLKDKMSLGKRPIEYIAYENLLEEAKIRDRDGRQGAAERLIELRQVDRSRRTVFVEGDSDQEKAAVYYSQYLKGRLEKL